MKVRALLLFFAAAHLAGPVSAQEEARLLLKHFKMLREEPCIQVMAMQDDFSKSRSNDLELVFSWHSYVQGIADVLYPNDPNGFAITMGSLFRACGNNPSAPMSEIGKSLANQ